ncbi:MAG: class I SAM-dependent methyltransferase [Pseudomonadota bacterium]
MKLYDSLAEWYPLFTRVEDYEEEAAWFTKHLQPGDGRPTLLEIGSGQGANALYMKRHFEITLVEPAPPMRRLSEALNPELEHLDGDMRTLRLGRQFDRVFIHDAIVYMTTREDLAAMFATVDAHLSPGGIALLAPDHLADTFVPNWDDGGSDAPDGSGVRFIEHSYDPDPKDEQYTVDYAIMIHARDGSVRVEHDRHVEGLFSREVWLDAARAAGFDATTKVFAHSDFEEGEIYEPIICRKPS